MDEFIFVLRQKSLLLYDNSKTMIRTLLFYLTSLLGLTLVSCTKYNIQGTSDVDGVDGRMLYLKEMADGEVKSLDSCDVVHGKFCFSGSLDSVRVVMLCIEDQPIMPVVLEDGDITVTLNGQGQHCNGTVLNDTLDAFNLRYRQLIADLADLQHQQNQAIMNGDDMEAVNRRLSAENQRLLMKEDKMVTNFITENFDNCLGPYVFQMATSNYEAPMLTPWIEALMTKATAKFKNDSYVKEYLEKAKYNQDIMTGMSPDQAPAPGADQAPAPGIEQTTENAASAPATLSQPQQNVLNAAPTPNELAGSTQQQK